LSPKYSPDRLIPAIGEQLTAMSVAINIAVGCKGRGDANIRTIAARSTGSHRDRLMG